MNQPIDILKRLLKQYPVAKLRDHFNIKVTGTDHVIEEIFKSGINQTGILDFAEANFECCKQHVYMLEYTSKNSFPVDFQVLNTLRYKTLTLNNRNTLSYFLKVTFSVYDIIKRAEIDVEFLWPVRVQYFYNSASKTWILLIKIVILERKLKEIFSTRIVNLGKSFDEKSIVSDVVEQLFKNNIHASKLDITKGIKAILETDIIDFSSVKYRKSKSIITEIMDEEYTLKKDNKETYENLMQSPLEKTICKFLDASDEFMQHFRSEPQDGMLGISLYPPSIESVDNIINLIIKNNF